MMDTKSEIFATVQGEEETLICPLCLDRLQRSILLPCSHIFCLRCMQDLISQLSSNSETAKCEPETDKALDMDGPVFHSSAKTEADATEGTMPVTVRYSPDTTISPSSNGTFSCPSCRRTLEVPAGGVKAFSPYVNISIVDNKQASNDSDCAMHQGRSKNIVCEKCDVIICRECKIDYHLHHVSHSIEDASVVARLQLSQEKQRLEAIRVTLMTKLKKTKKDQRELKEKKAFVRLEIIQRYARIIAEAEKYRDSTLLTLQTSTADLERNLKKELNDINQRLSEDQCRRQTIEQTERSDDPYKLVTVAKILRSHSGGNAVVRDLPESSHTADVIRPVYRSPSEQTFPDMKKFMGKSELVTLSSPTDACDDNCVVRLQFQCGDNQDATIFCVKAKSDGTVNVSFDPVENDKMPAALVCKKGYISQIVKDTHSHQYKGRISFTEREKFSTLRNTSQNFDLYAKVNENNCTWTLYRNKTFCTIISDTIISTTPYKEGRLELFSIWSKSCRAMDVDSSHEYFVVLEEAVKPATQRKVLLYRRPDYNRTVNAADTYTSPITQFQPADVCFYTLLEQQVLVIADEANDALHVAEVKDDHVTFTRFLCPGCPLLLQPTALNTDHKGRLWVGCRGGRILTVQSADEKDDEVY